MSGEWLTVAKTVGPGGRRKIMCCGSSPSMSVTDGRHGYTAYCHRCGRKEFEPHKQFTLAELRARRTEADRILKSSRYDLPPDFTTDIPQDRCTWFYRAGIRRDVAEAYGFGYSPFLDRVIIPIYYRGKYDGYVARSTRERPKYLAKHAPDSPRLFFAESSSRASTLAIVEDCLSAIRIAGAGFPAVALLGTSFGIDRVQAIREFAERTGTERYAVWTDDDAAGHKGSRKVRKILDLVGLEVQDVRTPRDPKYYPNREIRRHLDRQGSTADHEIPQRVEQVQGCSEERTDR